MRVIVTGGGTGGHIYPAIAIINKIKHYEPDSEILYIGTHNRMEKDIVPKYDINYVSLKMIGFNRKNLFQNFKTISYFLNAIKKSKKIIRDFKPDIVVGVGGYVTGPVIYAAHKLGIKTFIHEQNSIPGKANLFLSRYVDKIGTSFVSSNNFFNKEKVIFTGNPCSDEAISKPKADKGNYGLSNDKKLILIVMGSLGSVRVNEKISKILANFNNDQYEVVFVTGRDYYEEVKKEKFPLNIKLFPYIEDLTSLMKVTDLIISRAGASTMSEIIALRVPAILIPSPYVANNHQYKNAMDLVDKEAAFIIEESSLNNDTLIKKITEIFSDSQNIKKVKHNLRKLSVDSSGTKIYEILKSLIDRR